MKRYLGLVLATLLLAGCGGGGGSSSTPATASKSQAQSVTGSVVISIPTTGQSSSSSVRYPQFVSPNAQSVALSVNGGADQLFNVASGSSLCTTVAGSRNCTLTFGAPAGSDTFAFLIFAGPGGTGAQLASATTTQTIAAGTAFNFTVAMNAAIGTVIATIPTNTGTQGNCPDGLPTFNGVTEGCAGSSGAVTFTVDDPSGATITGTAPFATPITITTNDPSVTASPNQITAPGQTTVLTYSGAALGAGITNSVTVNLTIGTQVIPATVQVRRSYLYVANSNATFGQTPPGGGNIEVYTFGAGTGATPVRVISGGATQLSNPVEPLLDANDNLWVLDNGPYIGHSNPVINEYAPGANGNAVPVRQIANLAAITSNLACESMVFSPNGTQLWVTCDDNSTGTIHVLTVPTTVSTTASAAQTVSMSYDGWSTPVIGQAFDSSGNLYVAVTGFNFISQFVVSALPTTGSYVNVVPSTILDGGTSWSASNQPIALLVDNAGTLYASISYPSTTGGAPDLTNKIALWKTSIIPCPSCAPSATLTGAPFTTHAPAGIALDGAGNLYVSNPFTNQISVISSATVLGAAGNVNNPPVLRTINTGASPGAPTGMVIGP